VIPGDSPAAVAGVVRESTGEVVTPGGRTLIRWLLANDLVDAVNLFIAPVVVGQGERLFSESGPGSGSRADRACCDVERSHRRDVPLHRARALRTDTRHNVGMERVILPTCLDPASLPDADDLAGTLPPRWRTAPITRIIERPLNGDCQRPRHHCRVGMPLDRSARPSWSLISSGLFASIRA
jgi:hypothetical protein